MTLREWLTENPGRRAELAEYCGVTVHAIVQWLRRDVPAQRCRDIEAFTKGQVTRYELRPDVFGERPARAA